MTVKHIVVLARPSHWIKNVLVLLPVIFAMRMGDAWCWLEAALAAVAFCLVSGGVYTFNDILDRHRDRLHPTKKDRPVAAGDVSVRAALLEAAVLLAGGLVVAGLVRGVLPAVLAAYVVLQFAYTLSLKSKMIVDVICVALGFVLRAVAGAMAIRVEISPWLIICTFTMCLFFGFCKRYNETVTLRDAVRAEHHRSTLAGYTGELLTHLITLSAAIAVISFLLYASSARTVEHLGTIYLVYTLPIVIYAVFRFAMLSMGGRYSDPTDIALHDWPLVLAGALWIAAVLAIIRWGHAIDKWLGTQL